jgi:hypothetical protein
MKAPVQPVQLIAPSWPLQRWGINIVGNLTPAQGNYIFMVIAVEYFTKWIEAKPLTNVSSTTIKKFFWQIIICRYGVPRQITMDNVMFKEFCQHISMKVTFTSVYHPQLNRVVKKANSLIFEAMKKILEGEKKEKWAKVMSMAVWSHNTTVCSSTNFTLFRLMYGAKAMLPEEIKHQSLRAAADSTPCPSDAEDKDLLESDRLKAVTNLEKYQEETRAWRDPKVRLKQFKVKNMVLLRSPRTENTGKFEAKWIGPYVVSEKMRLGAYRLSDTQGRVLEHS